MFIIVFINGKQKACNIFYNNYYIIERLKIIEDKLIKNMNKL